MVFQVPKSKASIKQNRFEFQMPGSDKTYSIPLLKFIRPSLTVKIGELSEIEGLPGSVPAR